MSYKPAFTRGHVLNNGLSNGSDTSATYRCKHLCPKAVSSVKAKFGNYKWNNSGEADGPNTITVKASIEYPAGTFTPLTFSGGSTSATIAPGGVVTSDAATVAIPDNAIAWTRTYVSVGAGERWPVGIAIDGTENEGYEVGADRTTAGTIADGTAYAYTPLLVLGQHTGSRQATAWLGGDSKFDGSNDTTTPGLDRKGYAARAVGNLYAGHECWLVGTDIPTVASFANEIALAGECDVAICEWLVNALYAYGESVTTIKSKLVALWTALAATGTKVYQVTCSPYTNGNETTPQSREADRVDLNDWVRAYPAANPSGPLTGVIDVADVMETARNSGAWKSGYVSGDFLHENIVGHTAAVNEIDWASIVVLPDSLSATPSTIERGQTGQTLTLTASGSIDLGTAVAGDFTLTGSTVTGYNSGTHVLTVTAATTAGSKTLTHTASGATFAVTVSDTAAPNAPASLTAGAVSSYAFTLSWGAVAASPSGETITYKVYVNEVEQTSGSGQAGTSYDLTGIVDGDAITVKARDNAGNLSTAGSYTFATPSGGSPDAPTTILADKVLFHDYQVVDLGGPGTIRYTIDDSSPLCSVTAKTYSKPFAIDQSLTVRAIAVVDGAPGAERVIKLIRIS